MHFGQFTPHEQSAPPRGRWSPFRTLFRRAFSAECQGAENVNNTGQARDV